MHLFASSMGETGRNKWESCDSSHFSGNQSHSPLCNIIPILPLCIVPVSGLEMLVIVSSIPYTAWPPMHNISYTIKPLGGILAHACMWDWRKSHSLDLWHTTLLAAILKFCIMGLKNVALFLCNKTLAHDSVSYSKGQTPSPMRAWDGWSLFIANLFEHDGQFSTSITIKTPDFEPFPETSFKSTKRALHIKELLMWENFHLLLVSEGTERETRPLSKRESLNNCLKVSE